MDDELRAALSGLEQRVGAALIRTRTDMMARFDRVENRLGSLDAQLAANVNQLNGLVEQLALREQQLDMVQEAIRKGMAAESVQLRTLRTTVVEMQLLVNRMQSEIYGITRRLDEKEQEHS